MQENASGPAHRVPRSTVPTSTALSYYNVLSSTRNETPYFPADPSRATDHYATRHSESLYAVDQQFPNSGDYAHVSQDGFLQPWERSNPQYYEDDQYDGHDGPKYVADNQQREQDPPTFYQSSKPENDNEEQARKTQRDGKAGTESKSRSSKKETSRRGSKGGRR
jgi:hypothetical protein